MICKNCKKDLSAHKDAVYEFGHELTVCPVCHFPIKLFEAANKELDRFRFTIAKDQSW